MSVTLEAGEPPVLRVFGSLSRSDEGELRSAIESVPSGFPLVIDMSDLESVGLVSVFEGILGRPGSTIWVESDRSARLLDEIEVSNDSRTRDLSSAIRANSLGAERAYFDRLWVRLSWARYSIRPGESVGERMRTQPWEHDDPVVVAAWRAITHPANLADLKVRMATGLNSLAAISTARALEECRARRERGDRSARLER